MKKICFTIFFTAMVLGCAAQTAIEKNISGPNFSAIYKIESLANQFPALAEKQKPPSQEPLSEAAQTSFQRLFGVNRTLALEAGRLPCFQGDIKEKDVLALIRFTQLVDNATPEQETNLESLLRIGLQEFRRYSSPLEAIFWTLENGDYNRNNQILQLPLEQLLDKAWDFADRARWEDYETVTDRLNAPELVNYYQRIRFLYESEFVHERRNPYTGDAHGLFVKSLGYCYDFADFAAYCLEKGGYITSVVAVHPTKPRLHVVCQFEADGKNWFIDNGRPDKFLRRGIIPKEEYEMYREKENVRKGKATKDPVCLLQDNHGLALVYLMDQKEKVTSVKVICRDLGLSVFEEKVRDEYLPALVDSGFITKPVPHIGGGSGDFEYTINESLCERFKTERYHRPQNAAAKW